MAEEKPTKAKETHDTDETPSGLALKQVGLPKEGASDEELVEHSQKYLEAKLKARRG